MSDSRPIGIFDSGMGGLTVVKEVIRSLPEEKIIYFGDTARVPYGPKSKETVIRFSIENILFLLRQKVKLIIIACNTSSSVAISVVEKNFKVPIIGVINPGAREAIKVTKNNKIGIIGTRTTIKSRAYEKKIKEQEPRAEVFSVACPLFVPLAEEGWLDAPVTKEVAKIYLAPLKKQKIDTIVLGCTHYPLLKPVIKQALGKGITLVDSAKEVTREAKSILEKHGTLASRRKNRKNNLRFFVSDEPKNFAKLGRRFLGIALKNVGKVPSV